MTLTMQNRLLEYVAPQAGDAVVADVRIGLGYTAVRLGSGHAGVAWTPKSDAPCCTHFQGAGTLAGRPAEELLAFLVDEKSSLARAVGLATANALLAALPHPPTSREEVISTLNITPEDKVAMVGYFGPVVAQLRTIGCTLDIIELNPHHGETLTPEQGNVALAACSVAILTGTSLIKGTCMTSSKAWEAPASPCSPAPHPRSVQMPLPGRRSPMLQVQGFEKRMPCSVSSRKGEEQCS